MQSPWTEVYLRKAAKSRMSIDSIDSQQTIILR